MTNYAEDYFAALERLIGRPEDGGGGIESSRPGLPPVHILFYRDWPAEGVLSAFTLGVSLGSHVEELGGRLRVQDRDVVILEAHPMLPSELVAAREGGREELSAITCSYCDELSASPSVAHMIARRSKSYEPSARRPTLPSG
jgi:hypothetical protein